MEALFMQMKADLRNILSVQMPSDYTRKEGNGKILADPSEVLDYSVSHTVKLPFKVLLKIAINLER